MSGSADYAIETHDLTRRFGNFVAVDRVTLKIPKGQLYGFLGLNGAGKTTTICVLTTLLPPSDGTDPGRLRAEDRGSYPRRVERDSADGRGVGTLGRQPGSRRAVAQTPNGPTEVGAHHRAGVHAAGRGYKIVELLVGPFEFLPTVIEGMGHASG